MARKMIYRVIVEKVMIPRKKSYNKYVKRKVSLQALCTMKNKLASFTRNYQTNYTLRRKKIPIFLAQRLSKTKPMLP